MSFIAQFASGCDECEEPIKAGDLIHRTGVSAYVHDVCPEPRPSERRRPACARCGLEHPGEC